MLPSRGVDIGTITALAALVSPFVALAGVALGQRVTRSESRNVRADDYYREARMLAGHYLTAFREYHRLINDASHCVVPVQGRVERQPNFDEQLDKAEGGRRNVVQKADEFRLISSEKQLNDLCWDMRQNCLKAQKAVLAMAHSGEAQTTTRDHKAEQRVFTDIFVEMVKQQADFEFWARREFAPSIVKDWNRRSVPHRIWRWLVIQHRKNLPPPPSLEPPAE